MKNETKAKRVYTAYDDRNEEESKGYFLAESEEVVKKELLDYFADSLDHIVIRLATDEEANEYFRHPWEYYIV